jgi:hypothetical protein
MKTPDSPKPPNMPETGDKRQFDGVLKRMLASPPSPHKKPAAKPAQQKPAK